MTRKTLVENTMDELQDKRKSVADFVTELLAEAQSQATRALKESDDYTPEELTYWTDVKHETAPQTDLKAVVRDFLYAIGTGYHITTLKELEGAYCVIAGWLDQNR